jgi:hypothetical protein
VTRIRFIRRALFLLTLAVQTGCASAAPEPSSEPPPASGNPAPWSAAPLPRTEVPPSYLQAWEGAENRASCALLIPASLGEGSGADTRVANFSGGWGVAYDQPELRSAFGVAGTGVEAEAPSFHQWPFSVEWDDGSSAGYGPEGGSGPNQLAYLRVRGQGCLYNVWSRLGRTHLEYLLGQLRFVSADPGR